MAPSQQNFAHATRAMLSWHMQNFIVIKPFQSELLQINTCDISTYDALRSFMKQSLVTSPNKLFCTSKCLQCSWAFLGTNDELMYSPSYILNSVIPRLNDRIFVDIANSF